MFTSRKKRRRIGNRVVLHAHAWYARLVKYVSILQKFSPVEISSSRVDAAAMPRGFAFRQFATNIYDRGGKSLALVKNKLSQTSMLSEVKFESLTFLFISKTFAIVNCSVCRLKCLPVKVRKSKYMLIIVVLRVKIPLKKLTLREISRNFLIL